MGLAGQVQRCRLVIRTAAFQWRERASDWTKAVQSIVVFGE